MKYENRVKVGEAFLNIYSEGSGNITIVFMAGSGVTLPVLEYKPIYSRMSKKYRIAVIEKAGYGFSSRMKTPRTIENLVSEDRETLKQAGIMPPYVLAAHSYSGLEAVYWANTFPDEVKAVLSIDMGMPDYAILQAEEISEKKHESMLKNYQKLKERIAKDGLIAKLLRKQGEDVSGMLTGNELTAAEKKLYREYFYKNVSNPEYTEESRLMTANAEKAVKSGVLNCPCCFFISNMEGAGKQMTWRQAGLQYAEKCKAEVHTSDKGHFLYTRIPDEMADIFDKFLNKIL